MRYLSVCSGIEAATVAWHHLGWTPVGFSEIEPFPSAVLAHRFPDVPNFGDMTKFQEWPIEPGTIDVLVGGTPCQSFSVAGLRAGLSDPRGGLMLTYLEIARRLRPRWLVWENVPGVLSSGGGRDFGSLLGGLEELGYGWAYRVLDAQWCRTHGHPRAVPQRRRRVFVVGCLGDWKRAAQVLFERESVQRDSAARGKARQGIAADTEGCPEVCGTLSDGAHMGGGSTVRMPIPEESFPSVSMCLNAGGMGRKDAETETFVPVGGFFDKSVPFTKAKQAQSTTDDETLVDGKVNPTLSLFDHGDTRATTAVVNMQGSKSNACVSTDGSSFTLNAMHGHDVHAVAFADAGQGQRIRPTDQSSETLRATKRGPYSDYYHAMTVRRLTPRECERLQGFPDDYTEIPWRGKAADQCPDGPRYKALGNSMAVNCMAWIGERIAAVDSRHDI